MEFVRLGTTGLKVSRICLGTMTYGSSKWRPWVLDEEASRPFIKLALELGINFFDTADMYSVGRSEEVVGRALKDFGPPREELVIATKVYNPMGDAPNARGLSRKHIMAAIDASLKRLQTDYVDLYQIHRFDPETPIEETMEALNDVVRAGKALYLGASSMYAWQLAEMLNLAERRGWTRFISMQNHYNLLYREEEREMIPLCRARGMGIIPWSPLARGRLAGRRPEPTSRAQTDEYANKLYDATSDSDQKVIDAVGSVAQQCGVAPAQIALAWLLQKQWITAPIVGASKPQHLKDAVAALDIQLAPGQIQAIETPYIPHPIAGHE